MKSSIPPTLVFSSPSACFLLNNFENMLMAFLFYVLAAKILIFFNTLPTFVELEVTYTEPGFAGNTTTTSGKPATLETGLELQVPMFVNIGDVLKIDTRTCEYMERV